MTLVNWISPGIVVHRSKAATCATRKKDQVSVTRPIAHIRTREPIVEIDFDGIVGSIWTLHDLFDTSDGYLEPACARSTVGVLIVGAGSSSNHLDYSDEIGHPHAFIQR